MLDLWLAGLLMLTAAIVGDAVNYAVGRSAGTRVIEQARTDPRWGRWINPAYIARAHEFFERRGGKAIVLGRFVPIVRTFVPFVAGVAEMSYPAFALYNVTGAIAWVGICLGAGYLFGNVPIVKDNFSLVALGIVIVSLLPMAFEFLSHRRARAGRSVSWTSVRGGPSGPPAPYSGRTPPPMRDRPRTRSRRGRGTPAARRDAAAGAAPEARRTRSDVVLITICCSRSCSTLPCHR